MRNIAIRIALKSLGLILTSAGLVHAQYTPPTLGRPYQPAEQAPASGIAPYQPAETSVGKPSTDTFTLQGAAERGGTIHKNALGKPCLALEALARPQAVNPTMINHLVGIENKCPQKIHLQLCYANSIRCLDVEVRGYQTKDVILGTAAGEKTFRYTSKEKP